MERDTITMLVARNIEAAMEREGTNPAEVARRAGINPTGVYDILSGKSRNPRLDTLYKIATKGLGIGFSALFYELGSDELDAALLDEIRQLPGPSRERALTLVRLLLADVPAS